MSYDVYWVKNRAEKIADFEHPTLRGTKCGGVRICPQLRCSAACSGFHIDVSLQDTAHLTHDTAIPHTPQVPHSGTDYQKPTASCEAAPLWV